MSTTTSNKKLVDQLYLDAMHTTSEADSAGSVSSLVQRALAQAEVIRDVIILDKEFIEPAFELSNGFDGKSEFELKTALLLVGSDRQMTAMLFRRICSTKPGDDFIDDFIHEVELYALKAVPNKNWRAS